MTPDLLIIGRFPPPIDGQTMATARTASLLDERFAVQRVNLSAPDVDHVKAEVRLRAGRLRHYLQLRAHLQAACAAAPSATVLWPAVSPALLGHLRDMVTVVPAFQPGQRVYGIVHRGNFETLFTQRLLGPTARRLVQRLDGLVFLNPTLADACARWVPDAKRLVIPNTLDADVHCSDADVEAKIKAFAQARPRRLLFLSNMIPSKGYHDVLAAARQLHAQGLSFHLDFAGHWMDDADAVAFQHYVAQHGLTDVITHHGGLADRARIKALYLAADVFLLPSYYPTEAQPLSIIEAMNAGAPVVTTTHGSLPDLVTDGVEGRLVPPRDPAALTDAILAVLASDAWPKHAKAARARFTRQFSPAAVQQQWEALAS